MKYVRLAAICFVLLLAACSSTNHELADEEMNVYFLNEKEGGATVVQGPDVTMLAVSENTSFEPLHQTIESLEIQTVDLIVNTGLHSKALGELLQSLEHIHIREVWGAKDSSNSSSELMDLIEQAEANYYEPKVNDEFEIGSIHVRVLGSNTSNSSGTLSLKLSYGDVGIVIAEDPDAVEAAEHLDAQIVKLGSHGSFSKINDIKPIQPDVVIYSNADNDASKYEELFSVKEGEIVNIPGTGYYIENVSTNTYEGYEVNVKLYECEQGDCQEYKLVTDHVIAVNDPLTYGGFLEVYFTNFQTKPELRSVNATLMNKTTGETYGKFHLKTSDPEPVVEAGDYELELIGYYPDFMIENGTPSTKSNEPNAPAFVFNITGPAAEEGVNHIYFPLPKDQESFQQDLINEHAGSPFQIDIASMDDVEISLFTAYLRAEVDMERLLLNELDAESYVLDREGTVQIVTDGDTYDIVMDDPKEMQSIFAK